MSKGYLLNNSNAVPVRVFEEERYRSPGKVRQKLVDSARLVPKAEDIVVSVEEALQRVPWISDASPRP